MKITKIVTQKNNSRLSIFADGKFLCGLDLEVLSSLNLKVGDTITEEIKEIFNKENSHSKCMRSALSLLNYRNRTSFELRKKLKEKFFDESEIEYTVNKLVNDHIIDDNNFLETYISYYKSSVSKQKIIQKLWQQGVPNHVIMAKIDEIFNEDDEYKSCLEAMNMKTRSMSIEKDKLIRHLLYKGYKYNVVSKVINDHFQKKD